MAGRQDQAQAPVTVSNADTGQMPSHPHPVQHPPNYHQGHIIYQQPYNPANHFQQPPPWNQPPQTTVHYVQYAPAPQPEVGNFQDNKVQSYNHYGTVHFTQPMDNGDIMMRGHPQAYVNPQYVPPSQWYPGPGQGGQPQFVPTYANPFNVANDPTYHPNHPMNRPPGPGHRDDYQTGGESPSGYMQFVPFVPPIGVMESQAHVSASYTANWVSSTSSIPPELKDEPESDNISQYDSQRPGSQMNGDWTDQEDHLSPSTTQQSFNIPPPQPRQMPYVEKDKSPSQSTTKTAKSAKGERADGKRELTFDERLEKARMQKSRVENEGGRNGPMSPTSPRHHGQHGDYIGYSRHEGYNNNHNMDNRGGNNYYYNGNNGHNGGYFAGEPRVQQYSHPRYDRGNAERDKNSKRDNNYSNNRYENNQNNSSYNQKSQQNQNQSQEGTSEPFRQSNYRGRGGRGGYRGGFNQPPPPQGQNPYVGPPQMMSPQMITTMNTFQNTHIGPPLPPGVPRIPLLPGPFGMPRQPQDIKFHNTWLDASCCPMPLTAVMNMDTRIGSAGCIPFRGRGRGRGYRGGGWRGGYNPGQYMGRAPDVPLMGISQFVDPNSFPVEKEVETEEKKEVSEQTKDIIDVDFKKEAKEDANEDAKKDAGEDVKEEAKENAEDNTKENIEESLKKNVKENGGETKEIEKTPEIEVPVEKRDESKKLEESEKSPSPTKHDSA